MRRVIFMLLAAVAVAGCSKSEEGTWSEDVAATFAAGSVTRTTADCLWESGDKIGIITEGFTSDYTNICYVASTKEDAAETGFTVETASEQILFPNVKTAATVNFYAYYPFLESIDTTNKLVTVDISGQKGDIGAVDFLTASSTDYSYSVGTDYKDVTLQFEHRLAQVVMNISCNDDLPSLEGLTATLKGITTTQKYLYTDGSVGDSVDSGDLPLNVAVSDDYKTATVTAILHPNQYTTPELIFAVGDRIYDVIFNTTLTAGDSHTFNIVLGYDITGFESGSTIGGWVSLDPDSDAFKPAQIYDINRAGTDGNYYYDIYNARGLQAFADLVNGVVNTTAYVDASTIKFSTTPQPDINGSLQSDTDLSTICGEWVGNWTPIGSDSNPYKGTFDGCDNKITGLYIGYAFVDHQGLFGYLNGATISDLGVEGSVTGRNNTSGIAGYVSNSTISNCYFIGDVSGSTYVGGLVGFNINSSLTDCYHRGEVSGVETVGGIVGYSEGSINPTRCYHVGEVTADIFVGGLVGSGSTTNCYYDAEVDPNIGSANGVSTSVMKTQLLGAEYFNDTTSWAYDTENINEGYPVLVVN